MNAPTHQACTASTQSGPFAPNPRETHQDACMGTVQNLLALPLTIIDGWPVFDCRSPEDDLLSFKAPWGETLCGPERAAYSLGLRCGWDHHDTTPLSVSGCADLRRWPNQFDRVSRDLVKEAQRLQREWDDARANPSAEGEGGSVFYKPVAIAVCNFGASIIADRRTSAVRRFRFHTV